MYTFNCMFQIYSKGILFISKEKSSNEFCCLYKKPYKVDYNLTLNFPTTLIIIIILSLYTHTHKLMRESF